MPSSKSSEDRVALGKRIVALREQGKSWIEINAETGVDPARGAFLVRWAQVKPRDRIKGDLGPAAVALRDTGGLPWAEISARAGVSIAAVKAAYAAAGGSGKTKTVRAALPVKLPAKPKPTAAKQQKGS